MTKNISFQSKKNQPLGREKNTCMNCLKKELSLLKDLGYAELELLETNRSVVNYNKRETIYKQGSKPVGLICLNSGKVKITRTSDSNKEQIVGLKKMVDFLGLPSLMNDSDYNTSAIALEESSVCIIDKKNFFEVIQKNSDLSLKVMKMFAKELDERDKRLVNLTQKHLRARLADSLLLVHDIFGCLPDGQTLNATLKRSDLAGLSNMTTANVIRTLSLFAKEGIIEIEKQKIRILDMVRLNEISNSIN